MLLKCIFIDKFRISIPIILVNFCQKATDRKSSKEIFFIFCFVLNQMMRARSIKSTPCLLDYAVLLKPNLVNFCEQKFVQHSPITIAIDCNGLFLFIFEEKWPNYASGPKSSLNSASAFLCIRAGFLCPKCDNFGCLHARQDQNELHLKR